MSQYESPPDSRSRSDRIGREVKHLKDRGYLCDLQHNPQSNIYYLSVQLQRETMQGPQPVMAYFELGLDFPDRRPVLMVTVAAQPTNAFGEMQELPIDISSKTCESWNSASWLYQIVEDVQDSVQRENLRLVERAPTLPPELSVNQPTALPPPTSGPVEQRPTRSARRVIWTVLGGTCVALALAAGGIYYSFFADPCAGELRQAQRDLTSEDVATINLGVSTLERLRQSGQQGQGGSCASLANDPAPLRDAYVRYGQRLAATQQFVPASDAYRRALAITPASAEAQAGLKQATDAQTKPLWDQFDQLTAARTTESLPQAITMIKRIQTLDQQALNPTSGVSLTLSLYQTELLLGDLLYAQEQPTAAEHYIQAQRLIADAPEAAERLVWVERSRRMASARVEDWPTIIQELQTAAERTPESVDPAGRSIQSWLYTAHVSYGQQLIEQGGATAQPALDRANAALALSAAAADNGEAARVLKSQAEALLQSDAPYQMSAVALDAPAWAELLRDRLISPTLDGQPVNLVILTSTANLPLKLTSAQGAQILVSDRLGVARATLMSDSYFLSIEGDSAAPIILNFSPTTTYLVRVTPR